MERFAQLGFEFSMRDFLTSFRCAAEGVFTAVKTQRNMRIHVVVAVCALLAGFLLRLHACEWGIILVCIGLVCAGECVNTSIEAVVDLVSPEYHELAKTAKDCAAGAVLILAVISVLAGLCVYSAALLRLIA